MSDHDEMRDLSRRLFGRSAEEKPTEAPAPVPDDEDDLRQWVAAIFAKGRDE